MANVTVQTPPIGLDSLFSFKKPYNAYVRSTLGVNIDEVKLKVISIVSMRDMIAIEKIDPFARYYVPMGIAESDFKVDLDNDTPILTLLYNEMNVVKVPLSYVSFYKAISQIEYSNKIVLLDLGVLPVNVATEVHFEGLKDYIEARLGVRPEVKEVNLGSHVVDSAEHLQKETIRANVVTIHDTNETKLQKMVVSYNELLARFNSYRVAHP